MSERRITLETAAFLDSPFANTLNRAPAREVRDIVHLCLSCIYDGLGKAPRHLEAEDVRTLLHELLPARFARKDPRLPRVIPVLRAFFEFLAEKEVVTHAFEIGRQIDADEVEFLRIAGSGAALGKTVPASGGKPFVHRGEKVGRNDPCQCGSGRKFKACCARLG